jgi:hypothetical protein
MVAMRRTAMVSFPQAGVDADGDFALARAFLVDGLAFHARVFPAF